MRKTQGPIAVLALLLGLLLAHAPAAQAQVASRGSGLAEAELFKNAKTLRSATRAQAEAAEPDDLLAGSPEAIRSRTVGLHAVPGGASPSTACAAAPSLLPYHARAPPAA